MASESLSSTELENNVTYFARTDFRNSSRLFGIKRTDRRQHMYVIGKTGTGKSSLLNNLIVQDIANGEGVCVVDPHGELAEGVLDKIPEERMKDVVYFNPSDTDYHIGFNILELPDPKYKHLVASGLMAIFTKIWAGVWSPRMEYILNNCVLALLDTPGSTLLGIPRLLTDKAYRQQVVANVQDPVVKAFWLNEFESWQDRFRNEAIAPIQNKVGQFLSTALVRNIVGQAKSTIDIFDIMNEGKIFLVNVSKGRIGEDNSALLGAMLITKIQLAAMERVRIPEDERVDFYLYVDEFQNFATDSFAGILSEARKYRLNLIIAHQYIGQLVTDTSTRVRDAIFGNVGTMIVFRVGAADAEFLENEFSPEFTIEDIVNLPNYHVYLKLMVSGVTARPFSAMTLPTFKVATSPVVREDIIKMSQHYYARPREVIEDDINRWSGIMNTGPAGGLAAGAAAVIASTTAGARAASIAAVPGGDSAPHTGVPRSGPIVTERGIRFEAICSSCGTLTTLPFEPTPGRPVYCRDCMKKIESGEIKPVKSAWTPSRNAATSTAPATASAAPATSARPPMRPPAVKVQQASFPETAPVDQPAPIVAEPVYEPQPAPKSRPAAKEDASQASPPSAPLSLSELAKPHDEQPHISKGKPHAAKPDVSIDALRDAIRASLGADIAASSKEDGDAGAPPPNDEDDDYESDHSHRGR